MKRRRKARWIGAGALIAGVAAAALYWWLTPRVVTYPVEAFLPDRLSAAFRISRFEPAWQRHWLRREGPGPEQAVQRVMQALGEWDDWLARYGEQGARLRLRAYHGALFEALGEEAWLMFGEWGGDASGAGDVGFMAFFRGDTPLKARLGPLIELFLRDYRFQTSRHHGVTLYEYRDERQGRSVTFCQVGGWICASMRRYGPGPLPTIIDRLKTFPRRAIVASAPAWPESTRLRAGQPAFLPFADGAASQSALTLSFAPVAFWGHLRQFALQRDRGMSDESEQRLQAWQLRLDGVDLISMRQWGPSLFNLEMKVAGPRPARLARQLDRDAEAAQPAAPAPAPTDALPPELFQVDMAAPFARAILPLAGFSWEDVLENLGDDLVWLAAVRLRLLEVLAGDDDAQDRGRVGVAAFESTTPMIPALLFWHDQPPLTASALAPAEHWARAALTGAPAGDDVYLWLHPLELRPQAAAAPDQSAALAWHELTARSWQRPPRPPQGYVALSFGHVQQALQRVPAIFLDEKDREALERYQRLAEAFWLAFGGAVVRVDAEHGDWFLRLETM